MKEMLNLSDSTKNILLIVAGVILLLHALHVFDQTLNTIIALVAIAMIVIGVVRAGYWDKLKGLISKK